MVLKVTEEIRIARQPYGILSVSSSNRLYLTIPVNMGFLSKFVAKATPKPKETIQRIGPGSVERIRNILSIRQLESMPAQAARAFQLASDPRATLADFVSVIERDEVLSSRIIRVANSVYFFRGAAADNISKAVANIGLDELRCIISSTMLRSLLQGKQRAREQIWANSIAVGICCRLLAKYTEFSLGEVFLCGLLHDVGKLVMIRRAPVEYDKVLKLVGGEGISFVEAEEKIFEVNHVEVGQWVAESWNFPQCVISAIANHHRKWPEDKTQRGIRTSLPILVKAADIIAHSAGIGHSVNSRGLQRACTEQLEEAFEQLDIPKSDRDSLVSSLKQQFESEASLYQPEDVAP